MTISLCQKGGDFLLCSGNRAVHINRENSEFLNINHQGVAIRMVLDTSKIEELDGALNKIRELGENLAGENNGNAQLSASKMSRMLNRNI